MTILRCSALALTMAIAEGIAPPAFVAQDSAPPTVLTMVTPQAGTPPPVVYSEGYRIRARVHKISAMAFLPLVTAQALLGRALFESPTAAKRTWHRDIAWSLGGLFASNSVTGVWNLIEARKDPQGRTRRIAHGLLMLAADAGFVSTAAAKPALTQPDYIGQRGRHLVMAFTSIGLATTGYLLMIFGR